MTTQPKPSTSSTANRDQLQTLLAGEPAEMEFRVEISPRLQVSFTLSPTLVWGKWLEALARHGRDLTEAIEGDIPVDVNFRVSAQEVGKLVDTPEQQVGEVVEWCAIWGRRPAALLVEYLGSTVFTRRKRRLWHEWQRDLLDGVIIDPLTGQPIIETVVWEYSRFSRNPAEANPYVRERQQNPGYNLHQGRELDEGPKLLTPERANAIMEAFVEAERYVIRQRRSGMRSHKAKAELGYPVGKSRSVWHAQEGTGARKRMVLKPELDGMGIDIYLSVVAGDTLEELGARYGRNADRISSFVRSPSNAGLTCLRTDEERALERDYRGELYPPFLLIDKPDELCEFTVESVRAERRLDTPVQQGVPYWLWRRAQEALEGRPSATRGVQGGFKNLGSGFFRCDCGQRFTRHGSSYGCRKGHLLPTGRKRGRQPRYDVASDGRSHAKVADHIVHMVLRELAFACHRAAEKTAEYERAKTQAQSSSAIDPNGKLRRATCEAELSSIEAERERVGALFQAGMMSATKMSDEAKQLKQREAKARIELSGLSKDARRQRRALVKPGHSVESAWAEAERTGKVAWQRRLVGTYVDHILVQPRRRRLTDRLEVVFVDGLEVPQEQVRALLTSLWREIVASRRQVRTSQGTIDAAIALYDRGRTPTEIAKGLSAAGHRTVRSNSDYTATSVLSMLDRELSKLGLAYVPVPRKDVATKSLLDTIASLDAQGKPPCEIAATLNRSGRTMPRGKRWDERAVVGYLRGRVRPSTRNGSGHLPVHIEQKLSEMREQGKMLRELCEWLTAEGWSTRDGRAWHVGTVACIIRRVERDRRRKIALTVAPPQ